MENLPINPLSPSQFLTHFLETTHTAVLVLQPVKEGNQVVDLTFIYANPTAHKILNSSSDQALALPISFKQRFPAALATGLFDAYIQVLQTGQTYSNPQMAYHWDGVEGWFDLQVSRFEDYLVAMLVEVTALKQAQLEQQQQAVFLQGLLQTSPSGIVVYEAIRQPAWNGSNPRQGSILDFRAIFCNPAYEQLFNEPGQRITGLTFHQRFNHQEYPDLFAFYVQLVETNQSFRVERFYPHITRWLDVSGTTWQDGFLVVIDDVTERKAAESIQRLQAQQLEQVNRELERSNESLMEFSYAASHDLQEPLRKINAFANLLSEQHGPQLGAQGQDLVNRMQAASVRMAALIRDLLDYSRLNSEPPAFRPLNLNQLVQGVLTALEVVVAETGAVVQVNSLGWVAGDATQLAQVFQNLVTNALKFTKPDQVPQLTMIREEVSLAQLPAPFQLKATHVDYCAIRVVDQGIGFEPSQAERIFGAFQRLHGKMKYPGTGIGLAIVKRIVEHHGGFISAESQLGQGATFTVYLPAWNGNAN